MRNTEVTMKSRILQKIGINYIDPIYIIIFLILVCVLLIVYCARTNKKIDRLNGKIRKFMTGKDGKSLEKAINKRFTQVDDLLIYDKETNKKIKKINEDFLMAFQKMGIVKYDAFNEMGGKLSFAIALLNKENTGFVLNAMHSREGCYMYIKEIIGGKSAIILGDEEKEALDKAINSDNYME